MLLKEVGYLRPSTVDEAVEALARYERARPLAGGQSLLNVMKLRLASPEVLVDIGGLSELNFIHVGAEQIEIGAATVYDEISLSPELRRAYPVLTNLAGRLVDQQVRNRGTIGGNLCFNDPASNLPSLMVALDARMEIRGATGTRTVTADEFFLGPYTTAAGPGELLVKVVLPPPAPGSGEGYEALRVAGDSWSLAQAAVRLQTEGATVREVRVALGSVGWTPLRATAVEEHLRGREPEPDTLREAAELAGEGLDPPSDAQASGEYRRDMAKVMTRRALIQAVANVRR